MASQNHLYLVLAIFLSVFSLSFSPTSAKLPAASSKLVGDFCNGRYIGNREFCLKALSSPEAAKAKDLTQLMAVIVKLGAANGKKTLKLYTKMVTTKPGSPKTLEALNSCVSYYKHAIISFEFVTSELAGDPQTANYDMAILGPEITSCEEQLTDAKVQTPELHAANRIMQDYISMGVQITADFQ